MAEVLCIQPWIYDFTAFNQWIEPLGLLTVAGVLRAAGHRVALIDCLDRRNPAALAPSSQRDKYGCGHFPKVDLPHPAVLKTVPRRWGRYGIPESVFESELSARNRPDAVLVTSMMTYWYPGPCEVIRRVKARWPGIPVALGGVYATLCRSHATDYSGADVVIAGPGEMAALAWVNDCSGENRSLSTSPDDVVPAHDLRRRQGYVAVQTSRGCPFSCSYCAANLLVPTGFAPRAVKSVVDELDWCIRALGASDVAFYDDALLADADHHLRPILQGLIDRGNRVRLHTPNGLHARWIGVDLARLMKEAGFTTLRLGLETVDPRQAVRDGGKLLEHDLVKAVQALRIAGFTVNDVAAYVLIGRPGQDAGTVLETAEFAQGLGIAVQTAEYSPVPGTMECDQAVRLGFLNDGDDPLRHNKAVFPCGDWQEWEWVKRRIRDGNRKLRQEGAPAARP